VSPRRPPPPTPRGRTVAARARRRHAWCRAGFTLTRTPTTTPAPVDPSLPAPRVTRDGTGGVDNWAVHARARPGMRTARPDVMLTYVGGCCRIEVADPRHPLVARRRSGSNLEGVRACWSVKQRAASSGHSAIDHTSGSNVAPDGGPALPTRSGAAWRARERVDGPGRGTALCRRPTYHLCDRAARAEPSAILLRAYEPVRTMGASGAAASS